MIILKMNRITKTCWNFNLTGFGHVWYWACSYQACPFSRNIPGPKNQAGAPFLNLLEKKALKRGRKKLSCVLQGECTPSLGSRWRFRRAAKQGRILARLWLSSLRFQYFSHRRCFLGQAFLCPKNIHTIASTELRAFIRGKWLWWSTHSMAVWHYQKLEFPCLSCKQQTCLRIMHECCCTHSHKYSYIKEFP